MAGDNDAVISGGSSSLPSFTVPFFLPSAVAVAAAVEWIVGYFAAAVAFTPVFLAVSLVRACGALERARSTSSCVDTVEI